MCFVGGHPEHPEAEEAAGQVGAGLWFCQSKVCPNIIIISRVSDESESRLRRIIKKSESFKLFQSWKRFFFSACLPFWTQMVAGDQVNNLRDKHSSTDGQSWPAQGGDGRVHEQSGAVQGDQHTNVTASRCHSLLYRQPGHRDLNYHEVVSERESEARHRSGPSVWKLPSQHFQSGFRNCSHSCNREAEVLRANGGITKMLFKMLKALKVKLLPVVQRSVKAANVMDWMLLKSPAKKSRRSENVHNDSSKNCTVQTFRELYQFKKNTIQIEDIVSYGQWNLTFSTYWKYESALTTIGWKNLLSRWDKVRIFRNSCQVATRLTWDDQYYCLHLVNSFLISLFLHCGVWTSGRSNPLCESLGVTRRRQRVWFSRHSWPSSLCRPGPAGCRHVQLLLQRRRLRSLLRNSECRAWKANMLAWERSQL